jgi:hypothetical protein
VLVHQFFYKKARNAEDPITKENATPLDISE